MTIRRVGAVVGKGIVAALVAGVVGGVVARLLMRAIAEVSHAPTSFTVGGSLAIVVVFVVFLLPGSMAAVVTRRWPRWLLLGGGTLLLGLAAASTARSDLESALILTTSDRVLAGTVLVLFAAALVGQAVLAARVADRLSRRPLSPAPKLEGSTTSAG